MFIHEDIVIIFCVACFFSFILSLLYCSSFAGGELYYNESLDGNGWAIIYT